MRAAAACKLPFADVKLGQPRISLLGIAEIGPIKLAMLG